MKFWTLPIPALSESSNLRYVTFILLYFSQGIPEGITLIGIPAWMAMNGKSTGEIAGYSALVMVPFSFKVALAPIMERYNFLPMGRRRPWMLFGQAGIFLSLIALSQVSNPMENIGMLIVAALFVHLFIMFQDIATDSLVIDIVPVAEQGKANGFMWGAKTVGISLSLALSTLLIEKIGFSAAIFSMAFSICLIMVLPILVKEWKGERTFPWSNGEPSQESSLLQTESWGQLLKSFKQVFFLPNTLVVLPCVFLIMGGIHYARTLLPIFTIQALGWTNVVYSQTYSTYTLVGGIMGMLVGGLSIQKWGVIRMLQVYIPCIVALVGGLAFAPKFWTESGFVTLFIALFCTLTTLINIGVLALAMQLCWKRISALQFTFFMTIFNFGLASGAAFLGIIKDYFDWQGILFVFGVIEISGFAILYFVRLKSHQNQVLNLEKSFLQTLEEEGKLMVNTDA